MNPELSRLDASRQSLTRITGELRAIRGFQQNIPPRLPIAPWLAGQFIDVQRVVADHQQVRTAVRVDFVSRQRFTQRRSPSLIDGSRSLLRLRQFGIDPTGRHLAIQQLFQADRNIPLTDARPGEHHAAPHQAITVYPNRSLRWVRAVRPWLQSHNQHLLPGSRNVVDRLARNLIPSRQLGYSAPRSVGIQDFNRNLRPLTACDIIPSCTHRSPPCALVLDKPIMAHRWPVGNLSI